MYTYYPNLVNENNHILLRLIIKYLFLFSIVFNFISCKPTTHFTSTPINGSYENLSQADSLIQPYKTKLDAEMNEVLVISAEEFPKESGKAETKLGNLVADLCLEIGNQLYNPSDGDSIDFCLLNNGGLRTSLPKGKITRGKIFELMPFENELVVVTIPGNRYNKLIKYLLNNPQPIAGSFSIKYEPNPDKKSIKHNESYFNATKNFNQNGEIRILTSDYLANGGDKMNFFLNPIKVEPVGIKLRDAIIQYCKEQNILGKKLVGKINGRIRFE